MSCTFRVRSCSTYNTASDVVDTEMVDANDEVKIKKEKKEKKKKDKKEKVRSCALFRHTPLLACCTPLPRPVPVNGTFLVDALPWNVPACHATFRPFWNRTSRVVFHVVVRTRDLNENSCCMYLRGH